MKLIFDRNQPPPQETFDRCARFANFNVRLGSPVERVGFDWPDRAGSRAKVGEELAELVRERGGSALVVVVPLALQPFALTETDS